MSGALRPVLLLCALPAAFFVAFFLAPMAVVLIASLTTPAGQPTFAHYVRILADAYHWDVLWVTFRIGALTTLVSVLIGYPLACISSASSSGGPGAGSA